MFVPSHFFLAAMDFILDIGDQSTPHGLQSSILDSNQPVGAWGRKTQPHDKTQRHFTPSSAGHSVKQLSWLSEILFYLMCSSQRQHMKLLTKQSSASQGSIWPSFGESCKITVILAKCLLIRCCQTRHGVVN